MRDWLRRYRLPVTVVATLLLLVAASGALVPAVVYADVCGNQPDWWSTDYISWLACEVTNNGASYAITEITSPVLNTIQGDADSITSNIGNIVSTKFPEIDASIHAVTDAVNAVATDVSGIVSGVTSFFVPTSADLDPLTTYFSTLKTTGPLSFIGSVMDAYTAFQQAMAAGPVQATAFQTNITLPSGQTAVIGDFGPMAGGVSMFFDTLASNGLPQSTWFAITDAMWAILLVSSILSDLGVRMGDLSSLSHGWSDAFGAGSEERRQDRAWKQYNRGQVWQRHNAGVSKKGGRK